MRYPTVTFFTYYKIQTKTSSSAIAERPHRRVSKLWQKYKCEKRASNIALPYGVDVNRWSFYCFMSPCSYLMQNYAAFRR